MVKCDVCGRVFSNTKGLGAHRAYKHGIAGRQKMVKPGREAGRPRVNPLPGTVTFICRRCGRGYTTMFAFKRHRGLGTCSRLVAEMKRLPKARKLLELD